MSSVLSIKHLSMLYGARLLFDDANFNLISENRYGVVGANGTGKSTFLKLLARSELPSLGEITTSKQAKIGWLKQDQFKFENDRIIDVVVQGKSALWNAMLEKEEILNQGVFDDKQGYRLGHLEEIIAHNQGYTADVTAKSLLLGLGIEERYHDQPLSALSGGFKLRVLLAQTLFENPEILLLDEPTNHLDINTIAWLEHYLRSEFHGILIFVSHDHEFMNNLATHILDIDYGEIREYVGNYDCYTKEKLLVAEQKLKEQKYLESKIAHMQSFVDRFGASASKAKQAQSRAKQIEKIELPDIKQSSRIAPSFQFIQRRPSGKQVLAVNSISKQFSEKIVLKNVRFKINRGDKVAIIGQNGIGKSTLLKILLGDHIPDEGNYEWGHECYISYFAQDYHDLLDKNITVYDWLVDQCTAETTDNIRKTLAKALFTKDDVHKNVLTLSGGEAARLLFASMMLQKKNIIILDEPTNHLDIDARTGLAKALREFQGTVLFVSHDRHFVADIATRVIALTEQKVTDFSGNYHEYLKAFGNDYLNRDWMLSQSK
jgi:ATPase subunit of ABC transporter with duplicated ATPase domains